MLPRYNHTLAIFAGSRLLGGSCGSILINPLESHCRKPVVDCLSDPICGHVVGVLISIKLVTLGLFSKPSLAWSIDFG